MISVCFQGKPFNIMVIQVYAPTSNSEEAEVEWFYEYLEDLQELIPKKDVFFIRRDWNAKAGSQEMQASWQSLRVQNKAGQRLIEFCQDNALVIANTLFKQREDSTHGHHQMVNTEIRLIIFFAALYSQQKQDQEPMVAQIMNSLLPNSDFN